MIGIRDESSGGGVPALLADTGRAFAPAGWLQSDLGLEHRPGQEQMALAVAGALGGDAPLLVEAGTGVGKSLAYLVPGIHWAMTEQRPLVVSTHTIALQEQLEGKDLPLVRRFFSSRPQLQRFASFKSAVLVGKGNYLCGTRLALALEGKAELFPSAEGVELQRVAAWARETTEGLRHELQPPPPPEVWDAVNADSGACNKRNCTAETCFYQKAKSRLRQAQVIIVNHSLLFALLGAGGEVDGDGVLYPKDGVILDEAHTVPAVATDHLGLSLSSFGLERLLRHVFHPERGRGLLKRLGRPRDREAVAIALEAAGEFFADLDARLLGRENLLRLREPLGGEGRLEACLEHVAQVLSTIANQMEDGPARDEVAEQKRRISSWRAELVQFRAQAREDQVHWLERAGRRQDILHLRTAPLDVAPLLRQALFRRGVPVVLTSATLAIGRSLEAFAGKVGADGAEGLLVPSPFDFERHMRVCVAEDMPEPGADRRMDLGWLAEQVSWCAQAVPGGSLVLFTSHADLRAVAALVGPELEAAGRPVFVQGIGASRTELVRRFRASGRGVLMGTDSFWTGIDVPGAALSQVILARLPFEFPNHPVPEARAEWVRERGGNPFAELTLPEALVQFRQGVGRLIRTQEDRGVITILDSRMLTKSYGRQFVECLPCRSFKRFHRGNRTAIVRLPD